MGMRACVSGVKLHLYSFTANHSIPAPLRTVNQAKIRKFAGVVIQFHFLLYLTFYILQNSETLLVRDWVFH